MITNEMKRNLLLLLSFLLLLTMNVHAGQKDSLRFNQERVYLGARVGLSTAEADFSSFGADKFRPGYGAGLNVGYRFTDVWSLELAATWGQVFLADQDCCQSRHYFLGTDINRYHPTLIPEGLGGQYYSDLVSKTFVQRYGLQVNMNLLGFFQSTTTGRWGLEFSPALYAVGTSSDILAKTGNTPLAENINKWHLGYGAKLQATYAIAENMNIGIYGGYTQLTGKQLDGMPKLHVTNHVLDFGIKFTFGFKKSGKIRRPAVQSNTVAPVVAPAPEQQTDVAKTEVVQSEHSASTEAPVQHVEIAIVPEQKTPVHKLASEVSAQQPVTPTVATEERKAEVPAETVPDSCMCNLKESNFPVIYFSFNSIWIEPSQRAKVKEIADRLKADKSIRIRVTGWCDPVGSEAANKRVSLQRAEAVKRVLGQWLIPADRVETAGGGICHGATSYEEARCAITIEIL